jgi:hypothetical protein
MAGEENNIEAQVSEQGVSSNPSLANSDGNLPSSNESNPLSDTFNKLKELDPENKVLNRFDSLDKLTEAYQNATTELSKKGEEIANSKKAQEQQQLESAKAKEVDMLRNELAQKAINNDFKLDDADIARAKEAGFSDTEIELELLKFEKSQRNLWEKAGGKEMFSEMKSWAF